MLMRSLIVAGALLAAGGSTFAPAQAQDASVLYGDTLLSVGTGIAILSLPDVQFGKLVDGNTPSTVLGHSSTSTDFSHSVGWNVNGAITKPIGGNRDMALSGYWARTNDNDTTTCTSGGGVYCSFNALVTNPANLNVVGPVGTWTNQSQRDVTQAGAAFEVKQWLTPDGMGRTPGANRHFFALGADWRAIYQDLTLSSTDSGFASFNMNYAEKLDTNYFGAFVAYGGDFTPPFLAEHWRRWGLQSSFRLQGGLYYADSHYSGSLRSTSNATTLNSDATDSRGDLAFIGSVTLETGKQITPRSTLSLENKLEYYSFVPSMNYNDTISTMRTGPNVGTSIGSADAWAYRATLRFSIALGPDGLFTGH